MLNVGDQSAQNVQDPVAAQIVSVGLVVAQEHITAGSMESRLVNADENACIDRWNLANILLISLCSSVGNKRK